MKKYLCYVMATLLFSVTLGCSQEDVVEPNGLPLKDIKAGYYEAYSLHKAFNTKTGEPVYWIIATPIEILAPKVIFNYQDIRFYEIPRKRVISIPDNSDVDQDYYFRGQIKVL